MSAWMVAARAMYALGGSATSDELADALIVATAKAPLHELRCLGLVDNTGRRGSPGRWVLTPLGIDWCEGRVKQIEVKPGGRRFVSTWLASLPRGLRIA